MKQKLLPLILLSAILSACVSDLCYEETPMIKSFDYAYSDEAFDYVYTKDTTKWNDTAGLKERLEKCDMPESEVKMKTTGALVKSIINYPMNYLVLFYNDPEEAISIVIKNSAVHRELLQREDAGDKLLEYYREMDIDELPHANIMFFEAFLASEHVEPLLKTEITELSVIVSEKLKKRLSEKKTYSMHSMKSLLELGEYCGFNYDVRTIQGGEFIGFTTIYTPLSHQTLEGIIYNELSDEDIDDYDQYIRNEFPNATILAPASARYNCHSYAWHNQSTSNNVWLRAWNTSGLFQLDKYWTNDLYEEMYAPYYATKVYYQDGDHSAVVSSPGQYISKWGPGPLIKHAPSYCPYDTGNMRYFYIPEELVCTNNITITGNSSIMVNTEHTYTIPYKIGTTYEWSVEYMNNPSMTDAYELISIGVNSPQTRKLKCNQYGAYRIRVDEYYGDIHTAYGQLIVIVMGS